MENRSEIADLLGPGADCEITKSCLHGDRDPDPGIDPMHLESHIRVLPDDVGEIALGFTVEEFCGFYYWDYTNLPMHLTRYTSFFTSLGFSAMITLFMYYCYEPIMSFVHRTMTPRRKRIAIALFIALVVDMLYSFHIMRELGDVYKSWKIYVTLPIR